MKQTVARISSLTVFVIGIDFSTNRHINCLENTKCVKIEL